VADAAQTPRCSAPLPKLCRTIFLATTELPARTSLARWPRARNSPPLRGCGIDVDARHNSIRPFGQLGNDLVAVDVVVGRSAPASVDDRLYGGIIRDELGFA